MSTQTLYRFLIDNKPAAPFRFNIKDAAMDAVDAGFASPDPDGRIVLHESGDIETITANVVPTTKGH